VEPYSPNADERTWAEDEFRGVFDRPAVPAFWDQASALARDLRDVGDDLSRFVGQELERIVTLASLIGAKGPDDFDSLRDLAEMTARGVWEARGYEAGYADGLVDGAPCSGQID
jgi:hypothetical protein